MCLFDQTIILVYDERNNYMAEVSPDMSQVPAESGLDAPKPTPDRLSPEEGRDLAARAALEKETLEQKAEDEENAQRLAAGLKSKREKPLIRVVEPPSPEAETWGGLAKLGATWPLGVGAKKGLKKIGLWWDDLFSAIEKAGDKDLKAQEKGIKLAPWVLAIFNPLVGIGAFLTGKALLTPAEKSLRETEEAAAKKKEQEAKNKKKEDEKIKKLQAKGLSEDIARALLEGTAVDEKEEEKPKEKEAA